MDYTLTPDQTKQFREEGYLVFPGFFSDTEVVTMLTGLDALEAANKQGARKASYEEPTLGAMITHPKVMAVVEQVLGPDFVFHHLHASLQTAGAPSAPWHQDYEQMPQSNRSHGMVHLFYYLTGLNGEIGDLLFVPRTQNTVIDRGALAFLGTQDLPGTVVVDSLPAGSAVLVHSALWHARRAKPGGENSKRYFVDASYCQSGVVWPGYPHYLEMLARIKELGLDLNGKYAKLFDEAQFFDAAEARTRLSGQQGSLAYALAK